MITFFVSSTFNDMQAERDHLHQVVEPKVRREAAKYGESVRLLDLRWGVNTEGQTEEESSKKVLDVCLGKIDECDGYIVGMLGNRYGWIPDYSQIPGIERYGISLTDSISVTELEMKYGILDRNEGEKAILFFRDKVDGLPMEMEGIYYDKEENPKLANLKERLSGLKYITTRHYNLSYREDTNSYDGLEEFGNLMQECLCRRIAEICEGRRAVTKTEQIRNRFDAFIEERSQNYLPISYIENEFETYIKEKRMVFLLEGREGQGKTSFCAHFCKEAAAKYAVISFFSEVAEDSSVDSILQYFIERTAELVGEKVSVIPSYLDEKRFFFTYLLKKLKQPVFYVVDSIDHFEKEDALKFLPQGTEDYFARFIITAEVNNQAAGVLNNLRAAYKVRIPDVSDMGDFVWALITSMGKEIPKEILRNALTGKGRGSYLYGKLVVNLLSMIDRNDFVEMNRAGGNIEAINRYLGSKLEELPPSLEAMSLYFIYESGQKLAPDLYERLMKLWSVCPEGLRAQDYEAFLNEQWVENDFQRLEFFLDDVYKPGEDGSYRFIYRPMLEASKLLYENETSEKLYEYLKELPNDDPIKKLRFPILGIKHRDYELVWNLILSNPDDPGFVRVFKEGMKEYWSYLPSMFRNPDFLAWYLEKISGQLITEESSYRLYQALLNSVVPRDAALRMKYYETIAMYGNEPKYYENALDAAIEAGKISDIARLHLKVAKESRANSRGELEKVKEHLRAAKELAESDDFEKAQMKDCKSQKERDLVRYLIVSESKLWFQVIQMTYRFGTNGFMNLLSIDNRKKGDKYLEVIGKLVFRRHMIDDMDSMAESYFAGVHLVFEMLGEMKSLLADEIPDRMQKDFFNLQRRLTEYVSCMEEKTECIALLEEQSSALQRRLLSSMEWESMNTLALTYRELSELYSDIDTQKQIGALSEACRMWIDIMIPGEVFEYTEMLGNSIKELFKLRVTNEEGCNIPSEITDLVDTYKVIMTDYYEQKIAQAYEDAKRYPDEVHEERLQDARDQLSILNYDCRCMKNIPWDFCYYDNCRGPFLMAVRRGGKISNLEDIYALAMRMYARYKKVESILVSKEEDRTIELLYLCENVHLLLYVALYHTDCILPGVQELNIVKMMIHVLEKWMLLTEFENKRIGILYEMVKVYLRYAVIEGLTEEERLECISKKNAILERLQNKHIPSGGIHVGGIFGRITPEMIRE